MAGEAKYPTPAQKTAASLIITDLVSGQNLTPADVELSSRQFGDWSWAGQGINPVGSASPAVLTEVLLNEWHYVFGNTNFMAFPDLQLPHEYAEGTAIQPHIHVSATTAAAATGTFTFRFNGVLSGGSNEPPEAELVLTAAVSIPANKARFGYVFPFNGVIPGAGRKISSLATITLSYALTWRRPNPPRFRRSLSKGSNRQPAGVDKIVVEIIFRQGTSWKTDKK